MQQYTMMAIDYATKIMYQLTVSILHCVHDMFYKHMYKLAFMTFFFLVCFFVLKFQ